MKSCRVLRDSFGHIFPFFGTCFAHAASLNCLLHALAFHFLIQCIIDAHLAAKTQRLCVPCCLRAAPREELCHHGARRCHRGVATVTTGVASARCPLPAGAGQAFQSTPGRSWAMWPQVGFVFFVLPPKMVPSLSLPKFLVFPFIV